MTIYNIYIFDRMGTLLYHTNWNRLKQSGMSSEEVNQIFFFITKYVLLNLLSFIGSQIDVWYVIFNQVICRKDIAS